MKFLFSILIVFVLNFQCPESQRLDKPVHICDRNSAPADHLYRLPKTVTPLKYKIKLRADLNRYKFYGTEIIHLFINNRTDIIELNSVNLNIDNIWLQTRRIRVEVKNIYTCVEKETIILQFYKTLDKGHGNLTISFNGNINSMITGFYKDLHSSSKADATAVTDFGPTDARRAFPNWDNPSFKAVIELTIYSLKNYVTLSNMKEERRRDSSQYPGTEEVRFQASPPMTSNLLAFVIGKFDFVEKLTEDQEVLVRVYTPVGRQEEGKFALEMTSKLLMFYKYFFNTSYPLLKLDLVSIPDFPSSTENWGVITFNEKQILVNNQTSEEEKRTVAVVIAHALAHQWIGNLVTIETWNQMWITEGFATFIENEAIDVFYPNWKVWNNFVANELQSALELDSLRNSVPIETNIGFPSDIDKKFTFESFKKSAAVMRMFSEWIGKQVFRDGIRLFLNQYSYKSAKASDLWQSIEQIKDLRLEEMSESWVKQNGYPVINVKERHSDGKRILTLTQEKFMTIDNKSVNRTEILWRIPIKIISQFSPFAASVEVLMTTNQTDVQIKDVIEWEWVKLNHNSMGLYRVNYPIEMLNKFEHSIKDKSMPAMDRLNILSDLFAMVQSGRVSTHIGLKYLLNYKNDDNSAVWTYILGLMKKLDLLFSDTDLRENFWSFGREMLSGLNDKFGWEPTVNENLRVTKLRPQLIELLATFKYQKIVSEGLKKYEDIKNDNSNVTEELLPIVYQIVGANCDQETFDDLFEDLIEKFSSEDKANEFENFFETKFNSRVDKTIETSLERIRINAKWLNRDIIQIREFFNTNNFDNSLKDLKENESNISF